MKRISFWLVLPALLPGIAQAHGYYSNFQGVHYSPYALSYRHSGLVAGNVDYSPYALSYRRSGLIDRFTQYTPYAFSYRNSGLVPGYGVYPWGYYEIAVFPALPCKTVTQATPRGSCVVRGFARATPSTRPQDGIDVIRGHLRGRGCASLCLDRILRIDNELISVDVYMKDRGLLVKYWNPQAIERLGTKEAYKQKAYARYKQDWENIAARQKQRGGEIHVVNASDAQAIVAALESCPKLGPGQDALGKPALYAKQ